MEKTYTVSEFLYYLDNKDVRKLDTKIGKMLKNKEGKKILIVTTALLSKSLNVLADASTAVSKMDMAGMTIMNICKTAFYWIAIISCALEIAKSIISGDVNNISKIIGKYIVAFAGIYFLPWIFDLIKSIFG